MALKPSTVALTLQRDGISQPWGFRLSGGRDSDHPLIVTKVLLGSPSDRVLQAGDLIKKVGNYDARDLNHKDALSLFKNAGSSISVAVERLVPAERIEPNRNHLDFIPQPPIAGGVATPFTRAGVPLSFERNHHQSVRNNLCIFPPTLVTVNGTGRHSNSSSYVDEELDTRSISEQQPYRSTPLVLQGPKITKDPTPTMSYLRHHPNPMMRSKPTAEYEWVPADVYKKQQLADSMVERAIGNDYGSGRKVITKPYNTPIGLYSDQNIANSVHTHVGGMTPNGGIHIPSRLRKTVHYDPSKSETYRILMQESESNNHVQESTPVIPRVFSPVSRTPTKHLSPPSHVHEPNRASPQPHPTAPHPKIDYGAPPEEIHQSNSFKRLMHMVMTEY